MKMADDITVEISGLDALQAKLDAIGEEFGNKKQGSVLRSALFRGGSVMKEAMARTAPKHTGFLSENIAARTTMTKGAFKNLGGSVFIGPAGKVLYPAERATSAIRKAGKRVGKYLRVSAVMVARFLEFGTSKMSKKPFLTQSFESYKDDALNAIIETLKAKIETLGK
jgi:HK97 gp10 family phage protein